MIKTVLFITACIIFCSAVNAQSNAGNFSLGTRNTLSFFNDDEVIGTGIGGQFRIQFSDRLNSEWFFDYITSKNGSYTYRSDYHIGWSVLWYGKNNYAFDHLLQPYLIVGHCFDYSKVAEQNNKANGTDRLSMATQAGAGTHININPNLDCSFSAQYMLHMGKEIETSFGESIRIQKTGHSQIHGHALLTVSFNYKFGKLWSNNP